MTIQIAIIYAFSLSIYDILYDKICHILDAMMYVSQDVKKSASSKEEVCTEKPYSFYCFHREKRNEGFCGMMAL